jgi:hypothetical protein
VISLLRQGFTSTFIATTSTFAGVMEFSGGAVLWSYSGEQQMSAPSS